MQPGFLSSFVTAYTPRAPGISSYRVLEYWCPLLMWIAVTYLFSMDNFSSGETSRFILPLLHFFFPGLSPDQLVFWHGVVRKLGHVTEYTVLGFLSYRAIKLDHSDVATAKVLTFVFVLLAAGIDEFHQSLTASRSASLVDVGYDGAGGLLALGINTVLRR